jgi:hypothetical protein
MPSAVAVANPVTKFVQPGPDVTKHTQLCRELAEACRDERGVLFVAANHSLDPRVEERVEDTVDFRARYSEHMLDTLSFKIGDQHFSTTTAHCLSPPSKLNARSSS